MKCTEDGDQNECKRHRTQIVGASQERERSRGESNRGKNERERTERSKSRRQFPQDAGDVKSSPNLTARRRSDDHNHANRTVRRALKAFKVFVCLLKCFGQSLTALFSDLLLVTLARTYQRAVRFCRRVWNGLRDEITQLSAILAWGFLVVKVWRKMV